jgi:hypothetical protein
MQPLLPILRKYGFKWDPRQKSWGLYAVLYAYHGQTQRNVWEKTRKNQEAAFRELKPLVEKYNQEISKETQSTKPQTSQELMLRLKSKERLLGKLGSYGISIKYEWPDPYSTAEARVWVLGNTFPIKEVMRKYGFRFGNSPHGKGWALPTVEYSAILDKWAADVFRALPSQEDPEDKLTTPFSDMASAELTAWIRKHNIVEQDMRRNEFYDGEVSERDVLRSYLKRMPTWSAEHQQEVFTSGRI